MNGSKMRRRTTLKDSEIRVAKIRASEDPSVSEVKRAHLAATNDDPLATFAPVASAALTRCIAPYSVERFAEYWGKRPLHVRRSGEADRFSDILSLDTLDALLAEGRVPRETMFVLDAKRPNRAEFEPLHPRSAIGADLVGMGASIYWHFIDQFAPTLRDFCDQLETSLGMPLSSFAFLNPPHAQARALHWDPLDVFILQVEGEKIWDIHEPLVKLPLVDHDSTGHVFDTPRVSRVTLRPGDTLYVPRGFIHKAESTRDISFSITLGVLPVSWDHLVRLALQRTLRAARASGAFRGALPGWDPRRPAWGAMVDALVDLTKGAARPGLVRERALNETRAFEGPKFHLTPGFISASYLDDEALARLRFVPTSAPFEIEEGGDGTSASDLVQAGYRVGVTEAEVECMTWMRKSRRFGTRDLAQRFPRVATRSLLERLLAVGFVRGEERPSSRTRARPR